MSTPESCRGGNHIGHRNPAEAASVQKTRKRQSGHRNAASSANAAIRLQADEEASMDMTIQAQESDQEVGSDYKKLTLPHLFHMFGIDDGRVYKVGEDSIRSNVREKNKWAKRIETILVGACELGVDGDIDVLLEAVVQRVQKRLKSKSTPEAQDHKTVFDTVTKLTSCGSRTTRTIALSIMATSIKHKDINQYLTTYREGRVDRAQKRKHDAHDVHERGYAKKRRGKSTSESSIAAAEESHSAEDSCSHGDNVKLNFMVQKEHFISLRKCFSDVLEKGKDIEQGVRATRISVERMQHAVQWIFDTLQFRPGETRNVTISGYTLENFPVFTRTDSMQRMFTNYTFAMKTKPTEDQYRPIAQNTFDQLVQCLTLNSEEASACSYHYIDFMDLTRVILLACDRLDSMLACFAVDVPNGYQKLIDAVAFVKSECKFSKDFFKYKYEQELLVECCNGYRCAKHAVGGDCQSDAHTHEFRDTDALVRAFRLGFRMEAMVTQILSQMSSFSDLTHDVKQEMQSMIRLAKEAELETRHFAAHIVRGYWQQYHIHQEEKKLYINKHRALVVVGHKTRIFPRCHRESKNDCSSKSGMSVLGAMVVRGGDVAGDEQISFVDVVMQNSATQSATEVQAGVIAILQEIQTRHPHITEVVFGSDNTASFNTATHIPFIVGINRKDFGSIPKIVKWMFNEAQTGKSLLDSHFAFISMQLRRAFFNNVSFADPIGLFGASGYNGGLRATSTVLVALNDVVSKHIQDVCGCAHGMSSLTSGMPSVHEIIFDPGNGLVELYKQSGLRPITLQNTEQYARFSDTPAMIVDRFVAADLRPIQAKRKSDAAIDVLLDKRVLAVAINDAVLSSLAGAHAGGTTSAALSESDDQPDDSRVRKVLDDASRLQTKGWAATATKHWIKLSHPVIAALEEMFTTAMVNPTDPSKRYSAAGATSALKETILLQEWDQQYLCRASKVQQWFSSRLIEYEHAKRSAHVLPSEEQPRGVQIPCVDDGCITESGSSAVAASGPSAVAEIAPHIRDSDSEGVPDGTKESSEMARDAAEAGSSDGSGDYEVGALEYYNNQMLSDEVGDDSVDALVAGIDTEGE